MQGLGEGPQSGQPSARATLIVAYNWPAVKELSLNCYRANPLFTIYPYCGKLSS